MSYQVRVLTSAELDEWRDGVRGHEAQLAKFHGSGDVVPLTFLNDGWFTWLCPGCGYFSHGRVGDTAVSGWDEPRWTVEGLPDRLTLVPSLGCPRWRDGECAGHWWLRDGQLALA